MDPVAVAAAARLAELGRRDKEMPRVAAAVAALPEPPTLDVVEVASDPRQDPAFDPGEIVVIGGLADYLARVEAFLTRYVAFPSAHEPVAVALWKAHTHFADQVETSPILAITSAEMRSGKTRLLDCLELLVPNPERSVLPSESVVYTLLSQGPRPTLMIDEADAIFGNRRQAERYEGVRAILNAGNRKGTTVPRVRLEGKRREVERFDAFGPKAVAGIGDLLRPWPIEPARRRDATRSGTPRPRCRPS
jgi:hypothetical protein